MWHYIAYLTDGRTVYSNEHTPVPTENDHDGYWDTEAEALAAGQAFCDSEGGGTATANIVSL